MLSRPETCQILWKFHEVPPKRYIHITLLKEEHPKRRLTKIEATTKPDHVWPEVWTKIGNTAQNREKQELGKRKNKARQCSKTEMKLHYRSRRRRVQRNLEKKTWWENWKTHGSSHAVQKTTKHHESGCEAFNCIREEFHTVGKGFTSMSHFN